MSREFPGGDPGDVMYNLDGIAIGLTKDGSNLLKPNEYSPKDREWLSAVVKRRGIDAFTEKERHYINSVLTDTNS